MSALVQTERMQIANEHHAVQDVETDTAHTGTNMNPIDTVEKKKERDIVVQFGTTHQLQTENMRKIIMTDILQTFSNTNFAKFESTGKRLSKSWACKK